jgi:hypothetical protein
MKMSSEIFSLEMQASYMPESPGASPADVEEEQ